MGILRTIGKIVGGFFFTTFLALLILMLAITHFTSYNVLKPIAVDLIKQQSTMTPEQLNATYTALLYQCKLTGNETLYIPADTQQIELKCSNISKTTPTGLLELIGTTSFDKLYFKKYSCSFIQCIQLPGQEKFLFLMSKQANEFFEKTIVYLAIGTVLGLVILVAATENWPRRFKEVGVGLIFIGIFYFLIPLMKGYTYQMPKDVAEKMAPAINQMLDSISYNLLIIFIVGVILTVIGLVLGYLAKRKETKKK